jgi:hypothetical protein
MQMTAPILSTEPLCAQLTPSRRWRIARRGLHHHHVIWSTRSSVMLLPPLPSLGRRSGSARPPDPTIRRAAARNSVSPIAAHWPSIRIAERTCSLPLPHRHFAVWSVNRPTEFAPKPARIRTVLGRRSFAETRIGYQTCLGRAELSPAAYAKSRSGDARPTSPETRSKADFSSEKRRGLNRNSPGR